LPTIDSASVSRKSCIPKLDRDATGLYSTEFPLEIFENDIFSAQTDTLKSTKITRNNLKCLKVFKIKELIDFKVISSN
jgi:hypothetical protein|tara:strand:+ start:4762 stop:4995 length:234 start_codon:yes stop_codon:yes gene_type:complete